jgi:hypothetical protein
MKTTSRVYMSLSIKYQDKTDISVQQLATLV